MTLPLVWISLSQWKLQCLFLCIVLEATDAGRWMGLPIQNINPNRKCRRNANRTEINPETYCSAIVSLALKLFAPWQRANDASRPEQNKQPNECRRFKCQPNRRIRADRIATFEELPMERLIASPETGINRHQSLFERTRLCDCFQKQPLRSMRAQNGPPINNRWLIKGFKELEDIGGVSGGRTVPARMRNLNLDQGKLRHRSAQT